MATLPPTTDFTGAAVTEGDFKTALGQMRTFLADLLGTAGTQPAALAALGAVCSAGVLVRSTTYTLMTSERGKLIVCSGTWTLTLPPAASAGAGFAVAVSNTGVGTITVDPDSAELIGGDVARTITPGVMSIIVSTGTEWVLSGSALTDSTSTTSSVISASATAVKAAYDLAAAASPASHNHASSYVSLDHGHAVVGSFVFAVRTVGASPIGPGGLISGANLEACDAGGSSSSVALSGTWRCLGYAFGVGSRTLYQRIS